MATIKISELNQLNNVDGTDVLPIVHAGETMKVQYQTLVNLGQVPALSSSWNSVYSSVRPNSASWNSVYSSVQPNSASWNSVYSTTRTLSTGWAYRSGDIITEVFDISVFSATGYTTSTTTLDPRAFFIADWGNVNKWKKSGCSAPTITFYVVGRTSSSSSIAEFDLYNLSTGSRITNSLLSTNSTSNWQLLSTPIAQANFPTSTTVLALRSGRNGSVGQVELAAASVHLTWTVG